MKHLVEYFDEMSAIWDNAILHDKEQLNKFIALSNMKEGAKVLDVGSGTGVLVPYIRKVNKDGEITQLDLSQRMLNMSRAKNFNDAHMRYIKANIEDYNDSDIYDVILLYNVLPYLRDKVLSVVNLYRNNLVEGGTMLISHTDGRCKINCMHLGGDKRISDAELPDIISLINEYKNCGLSIADFYDEDKEYCIILKKQLL